MAGGETHFRDLDLAEGDFLYARVEQRGIDVALEIAAPDGSLLARGDRPNGSQGWEEIVAIAPVEGRYRFRIVAASRAEAPGAYQLEEVEQRPATPADYTHVEADQHYQKGRQLLREGSSAEAGEELRRAHERFAQLGLAHRQAEAAYGLCRSHLALGEPKVGATFCEHAAELYTDGGDRLLRAVALRTAGWIRISVGQPDRAIGLLDTAKDLYEGVGLLADAARSLSYLASAYQATGLLQKALICFENSLELNSLGGDEVTGAVINSDLGSLLLALNQPQRGLDAYAHALEVFRRQGKSDNVAIALRGISRAALRLGDTERARESIERALAVVDESDDPRGRAAALATLGAVLRSEGDLEEAAAVYEEAFRLAHEVGASEREAVLALELGYLHIVAGRPFQGLELCDQAFALFAAMGDEKGQASTQARAAEALRDLGRLEEAWERISAAIGTIEQLRSTTERRDLRADYFAFRQDYFEIALDILMRRHRLQPTSGFHLEALALNEQRLARELVEQMAAAGRQEGTILDPASASQERRLEMQLRTLASEGPIGDPDRRRRIDGLLAELDRIRSEAELAAARPQAPDGENALAERIQGELLDEDSLLLVYALGGMSSFLWALSPTAVVVHELPPRQELEAPARAFSELLAERGSWALPRRRSLGLRLSEALLGPVASLLEEHNRLIVIAEGALQAVPFAAIPVPGSSDGDDFLVKGHEVVSLPSVSTLEAIRQAEEARASHPLRIAAFADPVLGRLDPRVDHRGGAGQEDPFEVHLASSELQRSARSIGSNPYQRLEWSQREAEAILALAPSGAHRLLTGFSANREAAIAPGLASFSVLHFATHALVHPEYPELSGLVLSLMDERGRPVDGFLRAFEIARLDLPVDLVVLSACETSLGKDLRGEGMQGLNRAFFHAGAARVMASLWRISDEKTAELMLRFYRGYLQEKLAPAAALHQAQTSMLEEPATSAPYYWAGFLFHGDWRGPA